jgi:hypothetical protein
MSSKRGGGSSKPSGTREVNRSAVTGKFVTERYADKHPKTTVTEKVKPGGSPPVTKEARPKSK